MLIFVEGAIVVAVEVSKKVAKYRFFVNFRAKGAETPRCSPGLQQATNRGFGNT